MLPTLLIALVVCFSLVFVGFLRAWTLTHLPALTPTRNKDRRMLPVFLGHAGYAPKRCGSCYHFEKTGMGELQRRAPAAAEAAKWLTPAQMSATDKPWTEESGFDQEGQPVALGGPRWDETGVCHVKPGVMTFPDNSCEKWR